MFNRLSNLSQWLSSWLEFTGNADAATRHHAHLTIIITWRTSHAFSSILLDWTFLTHVHRFPNRRRSHCSIRNSYATLFITGYSLSYVSLLSHGSCGIFSRTTIV